MCSVLSLRYILANPGRFQGGLQLLCDLIDRVSRSVEDFRIEKASKFFSSLKRYLAAFEKKPENDWEFCFSTVVERISVRRLKALWVVQAYKLFYKYLYLTTKCQSRKNDLDPSRYSKKHAQDQKRLYTFLGRCVRNCSIYSKQSCKQCTPTEDKTIPHLAWTCPERRALESFWIRVLGQNVSSKT